MGESTTTAQRVRAGLEAIVLFDGGWADDMWGTLRGTGARSPSSVQGTWARLRRWATRHAIIAFDECAARTPLPPPNTPRGPDLANLRLPPFDRWCAAGWQGHMILGRRRGYFVVGHFSPDAIPPEALAPESPPRAPKGAVKKRGRP
eukprot:gene6951-6744_t